MTDEEMADLIKDIEEELDGLESSEKPTKAEKRRKWMLELQREALAKMKVAKEKGNLQQEINAGIDYALFKEHGKKHPLILSLIRSQFRWHGF